MKNKLVYLSYYLKLLPGILFLLIVGLLSKYIGSSIPYVSYLIIAIVLGIFSSNFLKIPGFIEKGIKETHKLWLNTGIVVLGTGVILKDLILIGPKLLLMVFGFIIFGLFCVEFLSARVKLKPKLSSCLASGTSVCGVSAIIATGGAIEAHEKDIAYAIATIIVFDIITVFSYPLIGQLFSIPAQVYGPWAGISMFSTGTTVAAGFAHSDTAGQLATICKMARNAFIGIIALSYSIYYLNKKVNSKQVENKLKFFWSKFPKPVIGFIVALFIANMGLLTTEQIGYTKNAYKWLFLFAFVGLGYNTDLREIKKTG